MTKQILLVALITIFASCNTDEKQALENYNSANELFEKKEYGKAEKQIEIAISLDSLNNDFKLLSARIKGSVNRHEEAKTILKGLLKKEFKKDTVNYFLGSVCFSNSSVFTSETPNEYKANELLEESVDYLDDAINMNIQYYEAYILKYKSLHNLKNYDEAIATINDAIKLFPDSTSLISYRGIEKYFLGDVIAAKIDINAALESNNLDSLDISNAYRFRSSIYRSEDKTDLALNDLNKSIQFNPKNQYAYIKRAYIFQERGLKEEACKDFRTAADLGFVAIYDQIKQYCN